MKSKKNKLIIILIVIVVTPILFRISDCMNSPFAFLHSFNIFSSRIDSTEAKNDLPSKKFLDLKDKYSLLFELGDDTKNEALLYLGFKEEEIENIDQDEIDWMLNDAAHLSIMDDILRFDDNGRLVTNECSYTNVKTFSENGNFRMITSVKYIGDKKDMSGTYEVSVLYTWLDMPTYRMNDFMGFRSDNYIYSTDFADYEALISYSIRGKNKVINNYSESLKDRIDVSSGVWLSTKLPTYSYLSDNKYRDKVQRLSYYLKGQVTVTKNSEDSVNYLIVGYDHRRGLFTRHKNEYFYLETSSKVDRYISRLIVDYALLAE